MEKKRENFKWEACLDGVHSVHARGLENGVVRLVGGVQDAVRQVLAAHQDAVKIALRAAVGDVALPHARICILLLFISTRFSCQEARCVLQTSCCYIDMHMTPHNI